MEMSSYKPYTTPPHHTTKRYIMSAPVVNLTTEITSHLTTIPTTSGKIRYLNEQGLSRGDISRVLGIRYQHVRNVLIQPLKKG